MFTENREKTSGQLHSAFGFGMIIGPAAGSIINGAFGYEVTMYFYAAVSLLCFGILCKVLPDSLDTTESESNENEADK
jgi:predicted MFS family arabinose efflux permease